MIDHDPRHQPEARPVMNELLVWAGGVVVLGGALGAVLRWVVRPLRGFARQLREFLSDWNGDEARPGVPARPGVMSRLGRIEWHVGNGSPVPMRKVVDETSAYLHDHLEHASQQDRTLARVVRHVDLPEEI